nr:hypothetical protein [uncultured Massilia sp.]
MRKPIDYQRMRVVGGGVIIGTLGAALFAVVGAYVGPAALVGSALAAGAALVALSHLLERRGQHNEEFTGEKV